MPIIAPISEFDADEFDALPFKPLTAQEAQALRKLQPPVSPWRIVGLQVVVGLLVALAAWAFTGRAAAAWSAAYGALAVVDWLAMLIGLIATLKVYWLALLMRPKRITD